MPRGSFLVLFIILVAYAVAGSTQDSIEIDEQVYAISMGIDKGAENRIRVTIQYPTYTGGGGGGGGGMQKEGGGEKDEGAGQVGDTVVATVDAPSILEAIDMLNTFTSRRISLVHLKGIVFSEEFAREGIKPYLEPLVRFRETRRTMFVAVCRGKAEDYILENKTLIGQSTSKAMELVSALFEKTGYFPPATFFYYYRDVVSPYCQPHMAYVGLNDFQQLKPLDNAESPLHTQSPLLPGEVPRKGDVKREFLGTAVFDGDKMVGTLDAYETRYFMLVTGEFGRAMFTIEDENMPGVVIPVDLRLGRRPYIKVRLENSVPIIDVHIHVEADLGAIQSRIQYERLDKIDQLNNMIKSKVEDGIKKLIEKTQKEFGTDIFGFGYHASRYFFTINEFEKYNWLAHYKEAVINVNVTANVRRTGLMSESTPVKYSNQEQMTKEGGQ